MDARRLVSIVACLAIVTPSLRARAAASDPGSVDPLTSFDANGGVADAGIGRVEGEISSTIAEQIAIGGGVSEITASGSFSYRYPIELPPGVGAAQPELAIVYDSHAESGLLGPGFSLVGLPAIARVAGPTDGDGDVPRGVYYDGHDSFALVDGGWGAAVAPGSRLVSVGPGLFHTATESWVQYQSFGHCGDDGFQPCAWLARDGKGGEAYYGAIDRARLSERDAGLRESGVPVSDRGMDAWGLSMVRDRFGNAFRIDYGKDPFMLYPQTIDYGCDVVPEPLGPSEPGGGPPPVIDFDEPPQIDADGDHPLTPVIDILPLGAPWVDYAPSGGNPGSVSIEWPIDPQDPSPPTPTCDEGRHIRFEYEDRPDATPVPSHWRQRLSAIAVYAGDELVRRYEFAYELGSVSRLSQIVQRGHDGVSELPRTTFQWSDGAMQPDGSTTTRAWPVRSGTTVETHVADIDGDGRDDLIRVALGQDGRKITYARGRAGTAEASTPPLHPTVIALDQNGDYRGWHSQIADVDRNGLDDLVLYRAWGSTGAIETMAGFAAHGSTPGGLAAPQAYADNAAIAAFVGAGGHGQAHYRLLVADTNGDQADDLVLVARHPGDDRRVALVLGDGGGPGILGDVEERLGPVVSGTPQPLEPVIADVDGDGLDDLVLTYVRVTGITSQVFRGSVEDGLQDGQVLAWDGVAVSGVTPYQVLAGDHNGDGKRDITLAYTGELRPIGFPVPTPHSRDVRTWLGRGNLQLLPRDPAGRLVDDARNQILSTASLPFPRPVAASPRQAFWENHAGDIDGDGLTDLALFYAGDRGLRAGYALARPDGSIAAPISITSGVCSVDAAEQSGCPGEPDGDVGVHRWHSRMLDVDLDGHGDLVAYYAGAQGLEIRIARGSATGLGTFATLVDTASPIIAEHADPKKSMLADSVELVVADLDGDGRPQLVVATAEHVVIAGHKAPNAGEPTAPDIVTRVDNGWGGTITVEHTAAAQIAGAIAPELSTCGAASPDECGVVKRRSRPLVTRVVRGNGLGFTEATRFAYGNGRYYPGPVVLGASSPRSSTRADLAFEWISRTDETTGREVKSWYRQDRPRERRLLREETRAEHGLFAATGQLLTRVRTFDHQVRTTPFGTHHVVLAADSDERFELSISQGRIDHSYVYTDLGGTRSQTECGDGICVETVTDFRPDDTSADHWLINRPSQRRAHHPGSDFAAQLVLDWQVFHYDGEDLVGRDRLLCESATVCHCFDSPNASSCTSGGHGAWVAVESGRGYDAHGNLTEITDALGRTRTFEYDQAFSKPTAEIATVDIAGSPTEMRIERSYDAAGRLETETDANGLVTVHEYDVHGRHAAIHWPGGVVESWDHLDSGVPGIQRTRHVESLGPGRERWRDEAFDGWGDVVSTRMPDGDGGVTARLRRELSQSGKRMVLLSDPHREGTAMAQVIWMRLAHDGLDRLQTIEKVRGAHSGTGTSLGMIERRMYLNGLLRQTNRASVAADGTLGADQWRTRLIEFDSRGRVRSVYHEGLTAYYWWDDAMQLWYVSLDPNNFPGQANGGPFVYFAHDGFGRQTHTQDLQGHTRASYDDVGNLIEVEDANGDVVEYTYDDLDRVATRTDRDGTTEYTYDLGPNGRRRLVEVVGPWGSESFVGFGFDERGNPLGRTITIDGAPDAFEETYAYDPDGRIREKHLPDGTVLSYDHDIAGQLREVLVDGVSYARFHDHDPWGNPRLRETPAAITSYAYNADHLLERIVTEPSGSNTPLVAFEYAYDGHGNVVSITDVRADLGGSTMAGSLDTEDTWAFGYDGVDRLQSATDHLGNTTAYAYDAAGNLAARGKLKFDYKSGSVVGRRNGKDEIAITLDAMGMVQSKSDPAHEWEYKWDGAGRLRGVNRDGGGVAEYLYDWTGRQIRRTEVVDGDEVTTFTPSPNYEVRIASSDPHTEIATRVVDGLGHGVFATITDDRLGTAPKAADVYGGYGGPLRGSSAGGQPQGVWFLHGNHLGSTTCVTDAGGTVVTRYRNDPWGERIDGSTGEDVADREYTGQRRDESAELLDYGARYYDPSIGRFLSSDTDDTGIALYPKGLLDLVGLNRHVYVRNNPVKYVDPTGHDDALEQVARDRLLQSEAWQNSLTEYEGEVMTLRDALARINAKGARDKCGIGCSIDAAFKRWRGPDAEIKLEFPNTGEAAGAKLEVSPVEGKVKLKDDNLGVDTGGSVEVRVPLGPVEVTGSISPDGKGKAKIGRKFKGKALGVGVEAGVEAGAELKYVGDGKVKVQPILEVGGSASVFSWLKTGVKLKVKDGSRTVDLPDVPEVRPRYNPFSPTLRAEPMP